MTTDLQNPPMVDTGVEWPSPGQDMPDQMGGAPRQLIMPGIHVFQLPAVLTSLWHDIEAEDTRPFLPNGQPNPNKGKKFGRKQLKFDRNNPLVVVGGKYDGLPMLASFSTAPRARGKKDDPKTAWIPDTAYLLDTCLNDHSRPTDVNVLIATINKYGGKQIRLETGLTAQCRPDKVRYIRVVLPDGKTEQDIADPTGTKGCGKRYYTKDFKDPQAKEGEPPYFEEYSCVCGQPTPEQRAAGQQPKTVVIRAFESVERFLPPVGA